MFRFITLLFLVASFSLRAEITEIVPGLTVDTEKSTIKLASCGPGIPGEVCLMQCFNVNNTTTDAYYSCNLQATANFNEMIKLTNGSDLYTGNTLTATDYRTLLIYPYQTVSLCFNYGKEVVKAPNQPNSMWVYSSSTITSQMAPPNAGPDCMFGTVGDPPTTGSSTLE